VRAAESASQEQVEVARTSYGFATWRGSRYVHVGVAIILLLFILYQVDFQSVLQTIAGTDMRYVAAVLALAFLDRYLMAFKWGILLRARGIAISNTEAFRIYLASGFVGTFLPGGVGADVFRALRTTMNGPKLDRVTASIVVERVIGMLAVIALALLGLAILPGIDDHRFRGLYYVVWTFLILVMIGLLISIQTRTYSLVRSLLGRFEKYSVVRMYLDFHDAYMRLSRHWKVLVVFGVLSFLEQGVLCVMNFFGARALDLPIELIHFFALIPLSSLAVALPISVGGIGVQEGAYMFLFGLAGMSGAESLSLSVLMRIIGWMMLIPGGLVFSLDALRLRRGEGSPKEKIGQ
jgi:hypothetical protein